MKTPYHDNRAERCGGTEEEPYYRCAGCGRGPFLMRGFKGHVCRSQEPQPGGNNAPATFGALAGSITQPKKDNPSMATLSATRNPGELRPHPLFEKTHHPMMPSDSPEWQALVDSVRQHGVLEAIKITDDGEIVDGRHRAAAAAVAGLTEVEVRIVDGALAPVIIAETLVNRRHYNKAARAYLLAPFAEAATEAGKKTRIANLRQNSSSPKNLGDQDEGSKDTLETFAARMGISAEYMRQARDIHARLDKLPAKTLVEDAETKETIRVREYVDRMLLSYGQGFQPVLAMLGYLAAGNRAQGQELKDKRAEYGRLAAQKFAALTANFRTWDKTDAVEKEILYNELPKQVVQWPAEVAQRLYTALAARRAEWAGN